MAQTEKAAFLATVRNAVAAKKGPKTPNPDSLHGPQVGRYAHLDEEGIIDLFEAQKNNRNFIFHRADKTSLASVLAEIVEETGAHRLICAADEESTALGVREALEATGGEVWEWTVGCDREEAIDTLAVADLGVTVAQYAVADIGTLVEWGRPECGKSVSLLPRTHVGIVLFSRLRSTLTELMAEMGERHRAGNMPAGWVHISGPSSTGDIENVLVTGAHGPVAEHYVLIRDA